MKSAELNTLPSIRDYLESIPKFWWCKNELTKWKFWHCAIGHLVKKMGVKGYNDFVDKLNVDGIGILLARANDSPGDPKENVINYLNERIKEMKK